MAEYPHSARRKKPRERGQGERRLRRKSNELVRVPEKLAAQEDAKPVIDQRVRRTVWYFGKGKIPLIEKVQVVLERRVSRTAWNCFKNP